MPRCLAGFVNIQKLSNQLTKEIKKNPAKAAVLGGLFLIAIWFWYPLIQKWFGGGSESVATQPVEQDVVVPENSQPATTEVPAVAQGEPVGKTDWRTIAQQISDDPWMKQGTLRQTSFDPFYPEEPAETVLTSTTADSEATPDLDVPPDTAGLAVTSVIVGGRVPIARINHQNYRLGDTVRATEAKIKYTLVEVHSWGVLLKGTEQVHQLTIDETPAKANQRLVIRNGNVIPPEN